MIPLAMSMSSHDTIRAVGVEAEGARLLAAAAALSDAALLARLTDLSRASRAVTVELLAHLGEIERRGLHRGEGCGRLYGYCTEVLKLSEAAAINRIRAARAARRFPVILEMLADGRVNLTSVRLLAPHLTEGNHRALLDEVRGMTRRDVDKVVARLSPRAAVPSSIRALAPELYELRVTLGGEAHGDLRWLQDAMRREIPDGDPSALITRALRACRQEMAKRMFAETNRPRAGRGVKPGSRDLPAAVQRAVWRRDGGRCAFVARNGRRCTERSYLEFHHVAPYGIGGEPTVSNVALRCRAHNEYESELAYGAEAARRWRQRPRAATGGSLTTGMVDPPGVVPGPVGGAAPIATRLRVHDSAPPASQPQRPVPAVDRGHA
jgi:5-methylcytosine-specific restriction endonuclease McrA